MEAGSTAVHPEWRSILTRQGGSAEECGERAVRAFALGGRSGVEPEPPRVGMRNHAIAMRETRQPWTKHFPRTLEAFLRTQVQKGPCITVDDGGGSAGVIENAISSSATPEGRAASAADDDRRDDGQRKTSDRGGGIVVRGSGPRYELGDGVDGRSERDQRNEPLHIHRLRRSNDSRRLIGRYNDRDVRATARITGGQPVGPRHARFAITVSHARNTVPFTGRLAARAMTRLPLRLAGGARVLTGMNAEGAVLADAQVDDEAAPAQELRRDQHHDEERPKHKTTTAWIRATGNVIGQHRLGPSQMRRISLKYQIA